MALHVVVVDPLPLYGIGAATVLSAAGHRVDRVADALAWPRTNERALVLLTLSSRYAWDVLGELSGAGGCKVVAVVDEGTHAGVRAVRAGATSVLARTAEPEVLLRTVEATAYGQSVLPTGLLAALTGASADAVRPSAERLSWLRQLSNGTTVADLARQAGYSERAMFRLLKALYTDLGTRTRMQAVMRAQELGWLPGGNGSSAG
ncbi:response regulator transcription factor [Actinoplanes awajinensis]|uniref:response regulator transcription factor n=1 Tax=Actinoplanes awajinensis TaxID=135946 RepID=UPI000B07E1D9|nr:response regulator transcription factor [Actinoplanes awajinensis]